MQPFARRLVSRFPRSLQGSRQCVLPFAVVKVTGLRVLKKSFHGRRRRRLAVDCDEHAGGASPTDAPKISLPRGGANFNPDFSVSP